MSNSNRSRLAEMMKRNLKKPGDRLEITNFDGYDGHPVPLRTIQIVSRAVQPDDWHITSKIVGDTLTIWRLQ